AMQAVKAAGFVALCVLGTFLGAAEAGAQTFRFRVCNHSNVTASVAVSHYVSPSDNRFVVEGWWSVDPGNCAWIGAFPLGGFYYYAEQRNSQRIYWPGTDINLCVRHPGPWERVNTAGYNCRSDETLRGFHAEFNGSNVATFTWTLN